MSDAEVEVKFGGDASGVKAAAGESADAVKEFSEGLSGLQESLNSIGELVGVAFSIDKVEEFISSMAELGEAVERTAAMTGLSVDAVQQFQFAVKMTGGDAETAGMALVRLERNIADAAGGSAKAQEAFARAGVSAKAIAGGNVNEILSEMAAKFSSTADGANKTALAMELAGRGGAALIPYLDQGAEAFESMRAALEATNSELTEANEEGFAQTARDLTLMHSAATGVGVQIMSVLNPSVEAAITGFTQMSENMSNNIKNGGALSDVIHGLGDMLVALVAILETVKTGFAQLFDVGVGTFHALADSAIGAGQAIDDMFHGKLIAAANDYAAAQVKALGDIKKGFADASVEGDKLLASLQKMEDVSEGKSGGLAPKLGGSKGTGKVGAPPADNQDDTQDDESEQRQIYAAQYDVKKEYDQLMVASGQMSHQEEFADLQTKLTQQQTLVDQSFTNQMAQYESDDAAYQKLMDQKSLADQKFQIEHMKLTQQATQDDMKFWNTATNAIEKNFDSMIQGMMQGTQTLQGAFQKLAQNLVVTMAEACIKILGDWLKTELQKTAATITGNAARVGSDTAAGTASSTAGNGAASSQILQDAYQSAANVYADVSAIPYVGWLLAPPAAAAAFAAVAAFDSFDVGTPYVPSTGLAMIHEGEAIVPKGKAQAWREGDLGLGGGGETHLHFHANSLDPKSAAGYFKDNAPHIAKAVMSHMRNGGGRAATRF